MTSINQTTSAVVTAQADTGATVIQRAHVLTDAHRAVVGTQGEVREARRKARKVAENRLYSACDADKRGGAQ